MKIISFKVAKAIKEAGYPQEYCSEQSGYTLSNMRYRVYSERNLTWYEYQAEPGKFLSIDKDYDYLDNYDKICVAPTYMEVWLWLWREKKIEIEILHDGVGLTSQIRIQGRPEFFNKDPEEVIITAIEYLVKNDLIK